MQNERKTDCEVEGTRTPEYDKPITDKIFRFRMVTTHEVEKIIKKLKNKKSSGIDEMSNLFVKKIYEEILEPLTYLINNSLYTGKFPSNYKIALVKPLYKNKKLTEISNYRPISLLPVLSKILERVVHTQTIIYLENNKLLYEGQYGFRKNRSTTDAVADLVGNIIENFNKGFISIVVLLNMSKAFDCLDPSLFAKIIETYGVKGMEKNWFSDYLSNRHMIVKYEDAVSIKTSVQIGAPQGSILGPLCYIWKTNNAFKSLKYCQMIAYADDTSILISGSNISCLLRKLESNLKLLSDWFQSH